MTIDEFIRKLENIQNTARLINPYQNELQRKNLKTYLEYFNNLSIDKSPRCLLVAEAPGKNGCAKTGIPFTDEFHIKYAGKLGCDPLKSFNEENVLAENRNNPTEEDAARDVWRELVKNSFFPLLWNIVPFHPQNNIDPTKEEIKKYAHLVDDLRSIFPTIKTVVAIGRNAEYGLKFNESYFIYVPYPKYKGLSIFKEKIRDLAIRFR